MRTKKTIRYITAAIAAAISFSLSSCEHITVNFDEIFPVTGTFLETETEKPKETEKDPETEAPKETLEIFEYEGLKKAEAYLESIGAYDFGGQTVFIKTTAENADVLHPDLEENEGNTYSEAVYERNRIVEERYGCEFHYQTTTMEAMTADIKAAIKNEEYYADLLAVRENELPILIKEGYLYNLRSLPFLDVNAEYFNASASKALSAGYHDYGIISYATIDPDKISCIFVNVGLLGEERAEKIVSSVKNGEWTFDMLSELTAETKLITDFDVDALVDVVSASAGLTLVDNSRKASPTVKLPAAADTVVEICRKLLSGSVVFNDVNEENEVTDFARDRFISGEEALYLGEMGFMNHLSSVPFEWSVLPIPKTDAELDGYRAYVTENTLTLSVPINTADPDGASVLLRALSAASAGYLRDAYVEYHMYNTVRSSAALSMIEAVYDTPFFSFERGLGSVSEKILSGTVDVIRTAAKDPEANLQKLFDKYDAKADDALEDVYEPIN